MRAPPPSRGERLHPAAVGVWFLEGAGRFVVGLVPLAVLEPVWALVALAGLAMTVGSAVIRYVRFTYRIDQGALIVEGGFLNRWRRVIPLERIQTIDVVQKLRHRVFGVVELRIEAAGGRDTEGSLVALRPGQAEALRRSLVGDVPPRPDALEPPLAALGPGQLLLAGITGGRVAVIAVLLGYLQELTPEDLFRRSVERLGSRGGAGLLLLIGVIAAFLLVSVLISVIVTVFVHWDFTVRREGDRLLITRGLLELRRGIVPLRRLQAIRLEENLLRRALGMASLSAVTAGRAGRSEEERETSLLLPVARRSEAVDVAARVMDVPAGILTAGLLPAPRKALIPRLAPASAVWVAAGLSAWVSAAAFVALALLAVVATGGGFLAWRVLGHRVADGLAVVRWGVLVRRTACLRLGRVQHLSLNVNPVERALGLATLRLAIPKSRISVEGLDRHVADRRFGEVSARMMEGQSAS